jgi:hypothetical protein
VNLDSDDLLAQIRQDWPAEYEVSSLRKLAAVQHQRIQDQDAEIEALKAQLAQQQPGGSYIPSVRPSYVGSASLADDDGGRHGG